MSSIYLSSRQRAFTLKPGDPPLSTVLDGWQANAVIVDNYSSQYLLIPNSPKFIDPGTRHAVVSLPSVSLCEAIYQAPPGQSQAPSLPGDVALLTFLESSQAPSAGIPTTIGLGNYLTTVTVNTGGATDVVNVPIPNGTLAVAYFINTNPPNAIPQEFLVIGHTTRLPYSPSLILSPGNSTIYGFPIDPLDTSLDITITSVNVGIVSNVDIVVYRDVPPFCKPPSQQAQSWTYTEDLLANLNGNVLLGAPSSPHSLCIFKWLISMTGAGFIGLRDNGFAAGTGRFAIFDTAGAGSLPGDANGAIISPGQDVVMDTNAAAGVTGRIWIQKSIV